MVDFFDKLYSLILDKNKFLTKIRFYSFLRYGIRTLSNVSIPIYFSLTKNNSKYSLQKNNSYKKVKYIVTLTSFPGRINNVWLVIETILRQSMKPDIIILWLSKEQFSSLEVLPKSLLKLKSRGLNIEIMEGDLRSHKKYYYCLKKYRNDIIVTIDDDIFYPSSMLCNLYNNYLKFPDSIIARYGYKMISEGKNISSYKNWETTFSPLKPDSSIFFGSGGGTLFPPGSLPDETLNKKIFMSICPYADDIWLNTMIRLNGNKVVRLELHQCSLLPVVIPKNEELSTINLIEDQNDKQLKDVRNYFISEKNIDPFKHLFN